MSDSKNSLKQIGIAFQNYNESYGRLPNGIFTANGSPHHSWQTQLLPYIDSSDLYNRIDFSRPWSDPINRPIFETPYPTFLNQCEPDAPPVNSYAATHYAGNSRVLAPDGRLSLDDIADGKQQTILAGQVSAGLKAWGDPTNSRDPGSGIGSTSRQFGRSVPEGVYFLMADGSVRSFSMNADPSLLNALSTPNGGERVPNDF